MRRPPGHRIVVLLAAQVHAPWAINKPIVDAHSFQAWGKLLGAHPASGRYELIPNARPLSMAYLAPSTISVAQFTSNEV